MTRVNDQHTRLSSDLRSALQIIDGDIVQAVQALKETKPDPLPDLERRLMNLIKELGHYKRVHDKRDSEDFEYPFRRGERQVNDVFKAIFPDLTPPLAKSQTKTPMLLNINTQSHFETFALGPYQFPRLLNGLWQLSSSSWGSGSDKRQEEELIRLVQSGFTAADMADHYGDAELVYANFRNRLSPSVRSQVLAATKWCVFTPLTQPLTSLFVLEKVKERYRRLGGRVELLQFDWYDYSCKDYLNILVELVRLTAIYPNLVSTIGLCNFDSEHTVEVCEYLIAKTGSVGIVSNQVQFSLIDSRPLQLMVNVCAKYGLKLLTYGSLCGGLLSAKWLGKAAPDIYSETLQLTPSQRKYHDMIMSWGTWQDFQSLLYELSAIADEHRVTLTNIATRWILQQPSVGALIVGTRLGVSNHVDDNLATFGFTLNAWDLDRIEALALGISRGKTRRLFSKLGDCGTEYRNEN
ncbi:Aldo/keto reductase [Colletotrichum higginsianum IMI 349063]|uniref:Aldo/keto reductase n=1 Tax=Colletotrichum higginsianum (strain IMI 349063) TaxID=759273 RepID=A0A1B7YGW0_COLHI|nr:Aldo/keto reductase [Colletotrichum higginsianum IMI 349063]OBR11245.1 Aldo/keto reductase [Colletotrichum higginsianum IMI 349063]